MELDIYGCLWNGIETFWALRTDEENLTVYDMIEASKAWC